jgi:hypothetical protein
MLGLDLPVLRRSGQVERLTERGWAGSINLPMLSQELYHSARWLRVFTSPRMRLDPDEVKRLANMTGDEVRDRLAQGKKLLTAL